MHSSPASKSVETPEEDNYDDLYEDEDTLTATELPQLPSNTVEDYDTVKTEGTTVKSIEESTVLATTTVSKIEPAEDVAETTNTPPIIKNRMPKIPVTAGKPFIQRISLETFWDKEDGYELQLNLTDMKNNPLPTTSWIQLNHEKREIYGL